MVSIRKGLMETKIFLPEIKKNQSVSIIGCGWLGLPLAKLLVNSGWRVLGSTTSEEKLALLGNVGIEPYLLELPDGNITKSPLFQSDTYVINIPPGRRKPGITENYPKAIKAILSSIDRSKAQNLLFVSSTSVYPENAEFINEEMEEQPATESGLAILEAERFVKQLGVPWTILRFGGLAGPGRHPGRFFAGKSGLTQGDQAVNFLHLEDAMGILKFFIENPSIGKIYNTVSPLHPSKSEFYPSMARNLGLPEPVFEIAHHCPRREISSEKLIHDTGYQFIHPDPMKYTF
jgi:nucleoside-diphosphate-sugar epimerase